jgi:excisionase family DNA binding protein
MPADSPVVTPWLSIGEAAAYAHRSPDTISAACREGSLRGNQPKPKGKWLIHRDDLDAWIRGERAVAEPARVTRKRSA